jgi:NADH-quinone oxidoreductase subunit J
VSAILFFIAGFGAIAGAIGVVMLRDPFFAVLALVGHLLSLAVLFLLLRAEFVAAVQVVVYAGAVMVLYVFVVAYVGGREEPIGELLRGRGPAGAQLRLGAAILGGALLVELLIALLGTGLKAVGGDGAPYAPGPHAFGTPAYIGQLLLTRFLLVFEAASFLLTIAAVGAVVLARRRGGIAEDEAEPERRLTPLDLIRPRDTGTMVEGVGGPSYAAAQARAEHGEPDAERGEGDTQGDASDGEPVVAAAGTSEQEGGW